MKLKLYRSDIATSISLYVLLFYPAVLLYFYREHPSEVGGLFGLMLFVSIGLVGMLQADAKREAIAEAKPELDYYKNIAKIADFQEFKKL